MVDRVVLGVPTVVLASGSPRRAAILRRLGMAPEIQPADVDETPAGDETAPDLVERLALAKLTACAQRLPASWPVVLVIAADTVVEIGGSILGKPEGTADAERMLTMLSGREHRVVSGVAVGLLDRSDDDGRLRTVSARDTTTVWFRALDADLIDWYISTGEAADKAGAYGIQGRGALLVDRVDGSYLNVVGLPITTLDRLCRSVGWPLHRLVTETDSVAEAMADVGMAP